MKKFLKITGIVIGGITALFVAAAIVVAIVAPPEEEKAQAAPTEQRAEAPEPEAPKPEPISPESKAHNNRPRAEPQP